jgi:hypothetical protein
MGQTETLERIGSMSALASIAEDPGLRREGSLGPMGDIASK